jgi:hypothetical protein
MKITSTPGYSTQQSYAHSGTGNLQDTKQLDQNRTTPQRIIIKTTSTENRERILKAGREKNKYNKKVNTSKLQQISLEKP